MERKQIRRRPIRTLALYMIQKQIPGLPSAMLMRRRAGSNIQLYGRAAKWSFGAAKTTTGALYDPKTDTWTSLSNANAPPGRFEHSVVWTGSEMVVWGGENYYWRSI